MPQMDPELLVLGRLMRSMEAVPGEERRVRICRFLMSRCSETWPIDMKAPGPPWDQLTLFIPTPERPQRWTHPEGGEIAVRTVTTIPAGAPGSAPEEPAPTVPTAAPEPAVPPPPPPPAQPEPAWTPAPTVTEAAPQAPAPAVPPPAGYPVPPPGTGQPDAGLDGLG